MVVSIIGAGALGKLYGGLLAQSGHDVHYLLRSEYETIQQQGYFDLNFIQLDKRLRVESPKIYSDSSLLPKSDLILISTKTTDNKQLESLLTHSLKADTTVMLIQNGIGGEETIQSLCPTQPIISCISTAGATRKEGALVDVFFLGALNVAYVDQANPSTIDFKKLFNADVPVKTVVLEDYRLMRWRKLIWSVPFCGLSIMYDKPCNIIASTKPYIHTAKLVMSELQDVAASNGVRISDDFINKTLENTTKVKDYYPSMYWDYVNGNPIELEYIFDNAIKIAKQNNIATPCINLVRQKLVELLSVRS